MSQNQCTDSDGSEAKAKMSNICITRLESVFTIVPDIPVLDKSTVHNPASFPIPSGIVPVGRIAGGVWGIEAGEDGENQPTGSFGSRCLDATT